MSGTLDRGLVFARSILGHLRFTSPASYGRYRGVFRTPAEAIAAAPRNQRIGYDHADLAEEYRDQFSGTVGFYDYPMLYWLGRLFAPGCRVFDFGGNIGTHFYSYRHYLTYPSDLSWTVCELPAIVAAGLDLARQQGSAVQFTTDFAAADGSDVFLASGSIQYVGSLASSLAALRHKPTHLLLGRFPLCEGPSFVTLQNGGKVFYPVHVASREAFIQSIVDVGYRLVDHWKDLGEPVAVPFHPEFKTMSFHGMVFRSTSS